LNGTRVAVAVICIRVLNLYIACVVVRRTAIAAAASVRAHRVLAGVLKD
jgi:hypothetical protein